VSASIFSFNTTKRRQLDDERTFEKERDDRDGTHRSRQKNTAQPVKMVSTISYRSHSQSAYRLTARGRHAGTSSFNASKYRVSGHASRKACVVRAEKVVGIDLGTTNSAVGIYLNIL